MLLSLLVLSAACAPALVDDATDPLFPVDHLLPVSVTVAGDDWDKLRAQHHELPVVAGFACSRRLAPRPYDEFPAALEIAGEPVPGAHVRKRGFFGSESAVRPSLVAKLDDAPDDGVMAGTKRFILNNALADRAVVRQCLAYGFFEAAGVPAPRCALADVVVNGAPRGVYVHVEAVDKPFLRRHFASDEGDLYEGRLADFREGMLHMFEKKTNEDVFGSALHDVAAALTLPDDELMPALDALVDLDELYRFWAAEVLIGHFDGYANNRNNFYVYAAPDDGKLRFIPWGVDRVFPFNGFGALKAPPLRSVTARSRLMRRLYLHPEGRARYLATLRGLLDDVWDEEALVARGRALVALALESPALGEAVTGATAAGMPGSATASATDGAADGAADGDSQRRAIERAMGEVEAFIRARRADIEAELAPGAPAWDEPDMPLPCVELGPIDVSLATTVGTLGDDAFASGTGSATSIFDGVDRAFVPIGARAGVVGSGDVVIEAALPLGGDAVRGIQVVVTAAAAATGGDIPLDAVAATAFVADVGADGFMGVLTNGAVRLDPFTATTPGTPIGAAFHGTLQCLSHFGPCDTPAR